MTKAFSCLLLTAVVSLSVQALADDVDHQPQMTMAQKMDACMKKQMDADSKMSHEDMKKHCEDTLHKMKESTGPVSGTMDPTKP